MNIPIEIISIFILFLIWFCWMIWHKLSLTALRRRYKPEDDLAKKGEDARAKGGRETVSSRKGIDGSKATATSGTGRNEGRSSIQKRTDTSTNKNSKLFRNFLSHFRRRKKKDSKKE